MALRHRREEEEEESGSDEEPEGHAAPEQTFVDEEGIAIIFFIHNSVKKAQRRNLIRDIETHGGVVSDTDDFADTVIINETLGVKRDILQLSYHCDPGRLQAPPIFVEPMSFVQRCIREGMVRHRLPLKQGMGGVVGRRRVAFTEEDEDNLCWYLSRVIPVPEYGGRTGFNVYKDLEDLGKSDPRKYHWARRHTWQSWRERYRNHASRLDIIIASCAGRNPPWEHGWYFRRRGWSSKHQAYIGTDVDGAESFYVESNSDDEDDVEEGNLQPEPRSLHRKRQRSGVSRTSLPSAAPAKRQRTDAYDHLARGRDLQDLQTRGKSKRKAVPPDDDDEISQHSSLFTVDEPDPDVRPKSPDALEYVEPDAWPNFRSPSPPAMPQTSQMTLVNAPSQNYSAVVDELTIPPPSKAMPSPPPANATAETERETHVHPIVSGSPQIHSSQQPSEANIDMPPSRIGERVEASPVVPFVPAPRPSSTKMKSRRPKPDVAPFEAPYRNTRSRSRSVEPLAVLPIPATSKRGNQRKEKKISRLEPLQESGHEEDRVMPDMPKVPAHISGRPDEELDVEKLLVAATNISGTPDVPEPEIETHPTEVSKHRSISFDTDDEQTRRDLRRAQGQLPQYSTSDIARLEPKDMLKKFNAKLTSTLPSRQSSARPLRTNLPTQSRRGTAASSSDRRTVESIPQPRTPVRLLQTRKNSTSSTETFPVAGTRASDVKKKYEQVEKRSPYKPPAGTRAAQHILSK